MSHHHGTDVATTIVTTAATCPSQQVFEAAVRSANTSGDRLELQRLLEGRHGKFNVNLYDDDGQTALHQSCLGGNIELVKLLVRFGADVRLANRDGFNALHIAAFSGHQDIAIYLINAFKR